jgi:hypothetical protein
VQEARDISRRLCPRRHRLRRRRCKKRDALSAEAPRENLMPMTIQVFDNVNAKRTKREACLGLPEEVARIAMARQ